MENNGMTVENLGYVNEFFSQEDSIDIKNDVMLLDLLIHPEPPINESDFIQMDAEAEEFSLVNPS